jgi:ferritin-like protein
MKKFLVIVLVSIGYFMLIVGCAGKNKIEIQKKLMAMSDMELIHHYEMIEMRMIDIDCAKQQSIEQRQDIYSRSYPQKPYNHLGHLHIGDHWNELKKEKELTRIEMRNRGISPRRK